MSGTMNRFREILFFGNLNSILVVALMAGFSGLASIAQAQPTPTSTPTVTATFGCGAGVTAISWSTMADLPAQRYNLGVGVVGVTLYAVGGEDGGGLNGRVDAYNPATDSWTTGLSSMTTARSDFGVGVIGVTLYAVGGLAPSGVVGINQAYNTSTNTWRARSPMPTQRQRLAVGVAGVTLYAVGGMSAGNVLNTVEAYDPSTNNWTTMVPMPTARRELAVGVINGILYAVGGNVDMDALTTLEAFDPSDGPTGSWTTLAPMPTARRSLAVVVMDGILYAVGGFAYDENDEFYFYYSTVEAYDPNDGPIGTWRTLTSMPTARRDFAMGVVGGKMYAVGGYDDVNPLNANEEGVLVYAPTCTPTPTVTLTPTPTPTITLTPTLTVTPTVSPTPTFPLSTLGKPVVAPVPATRGQKVCLYFTQLPASSEMEIYNAAGEKLGNVSTQEVGNHCWDTKNAAPGVYFVKINIVYADGTSETIWRKAVVIP